MTGGAGFVGSNTVGRLLPIGAILTVLGKEFDVVLRSRIARSGAPKGGIPRCKYVADRSLIPVENILLGTKLSEFHTGYRAFYCRVLEIFFLEENGDDFVSDHQMLTLAVYFGFKIGEMCCPMSYFGEASSIIVYGTGGLLRAVHYRLHKPAIIRVRIFSPNGRRIRPAGLSPFPWGAQGGVGS